MTVSIDAAPNVETTPAAATDVIGSEEIAQRKPAHLADAVATLAGVTIRGEGAPAVPVIRGLAGGRTLLLIDDARIVSERRAGPSASFVDPLTLGSVEVSRGPGSVGYGSDAIGGVVHMRPRDPVRGNPETRYDFWTSFGGRNEVSGVLESSFDTVGGAMLVSLHARSAADGEDGSGEVIDNSQYRDRGASLRFTRDLSWGRFRTSLMTSLARDAGAPSSDGSLTYYPDERFTLATFGADLEPRGGWITSSIRGSLGGYSLTTTRERNGGVESSAVKARDASLRVSGERVHDTSRLVTGLDFVSRFDVRSPGSIDDASRTDFGAFATWAWASKSRFAFEVGGRGDHVAVRNDGGYFGDRSRSESALSGYAAGTVDLDRGFTGTMQIASGFREPMLSDRYFRGVSGRGFITGNPDLEAERSLQFDGSLRWWVSRTSAALYVYDYRIRDLVERYRSGADFQFRNQGEARIRGVETELTAELPRRFHLRIAASLARGEGDGGAALDDIPGPAVHASLQWSAQRATAFVTASAYGRDDRPGPVETVRPGFVSIDAGMGWRFTPRLELRVAVTNATDVYRFGSPDAAAAHAAGRSWIIGVNR